MDMEDLMNPEIFVSVYVLSDVLVREFCDYLNAFDVVATKKHYLQLV